MSLSDIGNQLQELLDLLSGVDWVRAVMIATAIATLVLAAATVTLALATRKAAEQTEKAVKLQEDQLGVVKQQVALQSDELETIRRQLALAEDQARVAAALSRPLLRVGMPVQGDDYTSVSIYWAHGSVPATDIEIWIRTHRGLRVARHELMTPGDREEHLTAVPASAEDVSERLPFDQFAYPLPDRLQMWLGLDYRGADGKLVGWSRWTRYTATATDAEGNATGGIEAERLTGPEPRDRKS